LKKGNLFWRVNESIRAPEVRVIGYDGKQLGVMKIAEAIEKARKQGLTLVEVAPNAAPPVTKIVDFGKFRYQEEKKLRIQQKKTKGGELKEMRFSPFIAENDYQIRLNRVRKFLSDKNKVRLVVVFKRPQLGSKRFGYNLLKRIIDEFGESISIDMEPKFLGKLLIMVISPTNKKIEKKEEQHAETKNT
jgi:translation initiation factor IF-3